MMELSMMGFSMMGASVNQRAAAAIFVGVVTLGMAACSDDKDNKDDDTVSADAVSADGGATADTGGKTDAGKNVRNAKCDKFDDGTHGKKHPWTGYSDKDVKLTCNSCRGGYPNIVGKWRFVDGKTDDPRVELKSKDGTPYAEMLEFDGNAWTNTIVGTDKGKKITAKISGWYFCSDKAELAGAPAIFIQQTVSPEGAFGNHSNSVWRADILTSGKDKILLGDVGYESLKKAGTGDFPYCRIGSKVSIDGKMVDCADPLK